MYGCIPTHRSTYGGGGGGVALARESIAWVGVWHTIWVNNTCRGMHLQIVEIRGASVTSTLGLPGPSEQTHYKRGVLLHGYQYTAVTDGETVLHRITPTHRLYN